MPASLPLPHKEGSLPLKVDKEIPNSGICILPFQIPQIPHIKFSWLPDSQGGGGLGQAAQGQPGAINWPQPSDRDTTLGVGGNSYTHRKSPFNHPTAKTKHLKTTASHPDVSTWHSRPCPAWHRPSCTCQPSTAPLPLHTICLLQCLTHPLASLAVQKPSFFSLLTPIRI